MEKEEFAIGRVVGQHYEIVSLLGTGSMSHVYKARHVMLDQMVAIKFLALGSAGNDIAYKEFQQEAQAASLLLHPNIASLRDFGLDDAATPYIVMDYVDGVPLAQVIREGGSLAPERAMNITTQICDGLKYAHENHIVHRDIKPANIILTEDVEGHSLAKIVDFGIAKILQEDPEKQSNLTQTGEVVGTPYYMSPEQCCGRNTDARTDIYSLGCVLHEMLTGKPPFAGSSALETIVKQTTQEYAGLGKTPVPAGLESIIRHALEKEIRYRHQSMEGLRADLQLVIEGKRLPVNSDLVHRDRMLLIKRGVAWLIDTVMLAMVAIIVGAFVTHNPLLALDFAPQALFEQMAPGLSFCTQTAPSYGALPFLLPVVFLVNLIYHAGMESSRFQGTLGKIWLGLDVTNRLGKRLGILRATLRNLAKLAYLLLCGGAICLPYGIISPLLGKQDADLDSFTFICIVGVLFLLLTAVFTILLQRRHQLPHDFMTKCRVANR